MNPLHHPTPRVHAGSDLPYSAFAMEIPFCDPAHLYECNRPSRETISLLLESSRFSQSLGRWSYVLTEPFAHFRSWGNRCRLEYGDGRAEEVTTDPLSYLARLARSYAIDRDAALPPFAGGLAGIFNYEFKNQIEKPLWPVIDEYGFPDIELGLFDRGVAMDHAERRAYVFLAHPGSLGRDAGVRELERWRRRILEAAGSPVAAPLRAPAPDVSIGENADEFARRVAKAQGYIRNGDVFQVNLSHCLEFRYAGDALALYRAQRRVNPTSFAACANFKDYQLICGSPERLVRIAGREISTRPIAGTRPRGADAEEDLRLSAELMLSPKERAEHVMLIDLERNDLGRVCEYGSVRVDEMMVPEEYSHVRHIVSNVRGRLRPGCDAFGAIRALFPGGTITGAPKVRAMQIIDELEARARGPYTGSLGYIGFDGDCDLNIVIRSLILKNGSAYLPVGAGIVADSDPLREYGETIDKAKALLKALGLDAPRAASIVALD